MSLINTVKHRLCRFEMTSQYPVGELVEWAEQVGYSPADMLKAVAKAWLQLEAELAALQRLENASAAVLIQHEYWCVYAEQVCSFYRALVDD
ncbi:hypothetical protein [Marinimicrobium locisalis]|uniref:hypothetical protein n=1 Tax=Marinimicrobium locisalis TaxID=546022 RepID=UPI003221BDC2